MKPQYAFEPLDIVGISPSVDQDLRFLQDVEDFPVQKTVTARCHSFHSIRSPKEALAQCKPFWRQPF